MLTKLVMENFKPVSGRLDLPLRQLTVLAGLNSSGKSTVLQSVLLLAQTLANPNAERPLILNGNIVQLGTFPEVRNDLAESRLIRLGFSLAMDEFLRRSGRTRGQLSRPRHTAIDDAITTISVEVAFEPGSEKSSAVAAVEAVRVALRESKLTVTLQQGREPDSYWPPEEPPQSGSITATVAHLSSAEQAKFLEGVAPEFSRVLPYPAGENHQVVIATDREGPAAEPFITRLNHFLPDLFVGKYSILDRQTRDVAAVVEVLFREGASWQYALHPSRRPLLEKVLTHVASQSARDQLLELARKSKFEPFSSSGIREILEWAKGVPLKTVAKSKFTTAVKSVLITDVMASLYGSATSQPEFGLENMVNDYDTASIDLAGRRVVGFFGAMIRYLGPLRADPTAAQRFAPSNEPDDVGTKGEFAAAVYEANKRLRIQWWDPTSGTVVESPLAEAVNSWARYLSVAHSVHTQEAGSSGVSWRVQHLASSAGRSLNAVGVGVSQVLPILVAGLLAPKGAVILIEQPELHLHPRAQARLGDFFLGLTRTGKQVLLETHSDCLVNQLRLALVKEGEEVRPSVQVYFVALDSKGAAQFTPVQMSDTGVIENWPEGFFDESAIQEENITRASLARQVRG